MAVAFKDEYLEMDEKYEGKSYLMSANTLMTFPSDIDASRLYMNTSETKQSLTLRNPDVPRLSNGWENPLGRLNKDRSYLQLDGTWEVKDIIRKFKNGNIYTVVVYNEEKDLYDMIENPIAENLSEKFGFEFNTERMDNLKVGEIITDEILYKSTAYDKNMNYCAGKNAKVMYSTSTNTTEDAIQIRQGWADGVESVEVDIITASVNMNHVPLNIYGDADHYKVCPDFGEPIKDSVLFALRMINGDHILTAFKNESLREISSTDVEYYVSEAKESYIYDMDIYFNSLEQFPDTVFFHQLNGYYHEICDYADRMAEWATKIKDSGSKYTEMVTFFKSKYQNWNNPEYKWCGKEKNRPFGYMKIDFKVKSILGLVPGSKMAGRYGKRNVTPVIAILKSLALSKLVREPIAYQ